jgi:murein DD-endopeptidase MepM/ murein hydrolase activator NlpD
MLDSGVVSRLAALFVLVGLAVGAGACGAPAEPPPNPVQTPARVDIVLTRDSEVIQARVPANATLAGLLRAHEVSEELATRLVEAASGVFDPRRLRADQPYRLEVTADGFVREFVYRIDADRFLRVVGLEAPEQRFDVQVVAYEKQRDTVTVRGTIDRDHPSLVAALTAAGEQVTLAIALAEVFSGEIDFNNDLQPGDDFELVVDKERTEGEFSGYGPIVAAEFRNDGRTLSAFRFEVPGSEPGYYDQDGRSLRRFFLRSPLQFEPRISSGFSYRRRHPVLGIWRAHPAIDYRAPVGAPVVAIASGTVVKAGWSAGGGKTVVLRHSNAYESSYMHLSAFARGISPGARVSQGQLIGRVGATGLATGPHLDYRLKKNGAYVNPLAEHKRLPPGEPIPSAHLAAFTASRDRATARLAGRTPLSTPAAADAAPPGFTGTARPTAPAQGTSLPARSAAQAPGPTP